MRIKDVEYVMPNDFTASHYETWRAITSDADFQSQMLRQTLPSFLLDMSETALANLYLEHFTLPNEILSPFRAHYSPLILFLVDDLQKLSQLKSESILKNGTHHILNFFAQRLLGRSSNKVRDSYMHTTYMRRVHSSLALVETHHL